MTYEVIHLEDCLSQLPQRSRDVVRLAYAEARSADEIAGALGTSPVNARVLRHRALQALRSCMSKRISWEVLGMSAPAEPLLRLDDYVTGDMPDAEAATFEEELFAAVASDADAPADVFNDQRARGGRRLSRSSGATGDRIRTSGRRSPADVRAPRSTGCSGRRLPVHYVDLGAGGASMFRRLGPPT